MKTSTLKDSLISNYTNRYWPHVKDINNFLREYTDFHGRADDLLGLDCLNGGSAEVEFVAEILKPMRGSQVLEVGCGIGGPARIIAAKSAAQLTGVDLVPQQVASAQQFNKICRVRDNLCSFKLATAERLPFPDDYFDAAYEIEVFSHIEDKQSALTELARVLKKGAKVVFADFTNAGSLPDLERLFPETATTLWYADKREALLKACGFEMIEIHDRSLNVAEGYTLFADLFQPEIKLDRQTFSAGLHWWAQGKQRKPAVIRARLKFLKFCRQRKQASQRFLHGAGRQRIFDYCRTMIPACEQGRIKYEVVLARKI